MRPDSRKANQVREIHIQKNFTKHAPGSILIGYGDTKVLVTATIEDKVPRFLRDTGTGWITAEYSLLPGSTHTRCSREVSKGKPSGRTSEIQRLIGRALRSVIDFSLLGERTIYIDADVIQADGGTRTAAITGAMVALDDAIQFLLNERTLKKNPLTGWVAAVSVGKYQGNLITDLCYEEDFAADLDMNVVMTEKGEIVEVQGTAEKEPFTRQEMDHLVDLAHESIQHIIQTVK